MYQIIKFTFALEKKQVLSLPEPSATWSSSRACDHKDIKQEHQNVIEPYA